MKKTNEIHRGLDEREMQRYFKELMTFSVPNEDNRRIGKEIPEIEEYDLVDERKINGHLQKRFVRLHYTYFIDLLKELASDKSFYHTYITAEDVKQGAVPKNLSVLIKEMGHQYSMIAEVEHQKMYAEALGSRVLNFYGVSTVYNKVLNNEGTLFVLSLDFLRPYEHFYVAQDLCEENEIWVSNSLENNLNSIDKDIDILKQRIEIEFGATGVTADKEQIKRDFVMSYLIRVFLLGDTDFNSRNYGFIYDIKSNQIKTAPNYDFELTFGMSNKNFSGFVEKFKEIYAKYPDIMEEFLKKTSQLAKVGVFGKSKFDKIFIKETDENMNVLHFPKIVIGNAQNLIKTAEKENILNASGMF